MTQDLVRDRAAWATSGRLLGVAVIAVTMAAACSDSAPKAVLGERTGGRGRHHHD
jgi:hypothetical protein